MFIGARVSTNMGSRSAQAVRVCGRWRVVGARVASCRAAAAAGPRACSGRAASSAPRLCVTSSAPPTTCFA